MVSPLFSYAVIRPVHFVRSALFSCFIRIRLPLESISCDSLTRSASLKCGQYWTLTFLGFSEFQPHPPVSASTFVYFRKRITAKGIARINDILCGIEEAEKDDRDPPDEGGDNDGTLILDATCAPQDIKFPTDGERQTVTTFQ